MAEHPESFPVNTLVPIEGTPLEKNDVSDQDPHVSKTSSPDVPRAARSRPDRSSHNRDGPYRVA